MPSKSYKVDKSKSKPKKSSKVGSTKKKAVKIEPVVEEVVACPVPEEPVVVKPKKASKAKKSVKIETDAVCPVPELESSPEKAPPVTDDPNRGTYKVPPISSQKKLTKDELSEWFDTFLHIIEEQIELTREDKNRKVSVQVFKNLHKYGKKLKNTSLRVMRNPRKNTNSGFEKKKAITAEMAKFAGWDANEPKSRVEVSKCLNEYIKENNLQNPKNRREIIVDSKLSKLLKYDPRKKGNLSYSSIQTEIGKLFAA